MGQLHPLPIPAAHWSVVSVDFIVELPDAHGYDAMMAWFGTSTIGIPMPPKRFEASTLFHQLTRQFVTSSTQLVLFGFPFASCVIEPQPPEVTLTETQVQSTQSSLTHHTTKLSTLHQITDLISQSLQALLECLAPNSAPPAAAKPALTPSAPVPAALVTLQLQILHLVLPDAYNSAHSGRKQFLHLGAVIYEDWMCLYLCTPPPPPHLQYSHTDLCLNPTKPVPLPLSSSPTPTDLPRLAWINLHQLSSQVPSVWDTSECPVVSAGNHIHLQTCGVMALLDSGATGLFLDLKFVKCHGLTTQPLPKPILVYNIDGTPNKAGAINSVVDLVLHYWNHTKHAVFAITSLGRQDMILYFIWLCKHNSEVDWTKGEVTMSRCPQKCSACAAEDRAEHQAQVQEHAAIHACCAGPLPFADLDLLDPLPLAFPCREALYEDDQSGSEALEEECRREFGGVHEPEFPDKVVEVGDQICATTVHPLPSVAEIQASQTMSQQLAQAFAANTAPQEFQDMVPPYLLAFEDVFSKALFDSLLECKRWDHAIELLPDSTPSSCKVYPLMPREQEELNTFLQENLDSSHICPPKSQWALWSSSSRRRMA
ncbi:hypothetical protein E4T56_gene1532 [Termitomyces sp. T112]|nr:hypothetical protein E4T56_gene1532 [Termitomyces sp. T112]